jgi:hypothetical protein
VTGFERWCAAGLRLGAPTMVRRALALGVRGYPPPARDIRRVAQRAAEELGVTVHPETHTQMCVQCGLWFPSAGGTLCDGCRAE